MIEPRKAFVENKDLSKNWIDVVDGRQFQEAAKAAMLEFTMGCATGIAELNEGHAIANQIVGANKFLRILMTLTVPAAPPRQPKNQNLDHSTMK